MNRKIFEAKNSILRQKKFYVTLMTLMIIGFTAGIIYVFFLKGNDKSLVTNNVSNFFNLVKTSNGVNYSKSLFNSIGINLGYCLLIWLLGISIIGFPIILGVLIFKSFVLGFSIAGIILNYGFKGVLGAILYVFPHQIIMLCVFLLLSFYSLSFCYKLFQNLFLKKNIIFKYGMQKYTKILIISIIVVIINSIYEVFISTYFIKLFTLIIK